MNILKLPRPLNSTIMETTKKKRKKDDHLKEILNDEFKENAA